MLLFLFICNKKSLTVGNEIEFPLRMAVHGDKRKEFGDRTFIIAEWYESIAVMSVFFEYIFFSHVIPRLNTIYQSTIV